MMLLFDTSPLEDDRPKKKRAKAAAVAPQPEPQYQQPRAALTSAEAVGPWDGSDMCVDDRCQGWCHDIVAERGGFWKLECCYCGTGQWIPKSNVEAEAVPEAAQEEEEFRFPAGSRYEGKTIAEVVEKNPDCWPFLRYSADSHPEAAVKKACQEWLARNPTTR